jgi:hypothetical protein
MKTIDLITGQKIHGLPLEHIPIRAEETGIPLKRLAGLVLRNRLDDPIGWWIDDQLVVYNDWRLHALQAREGLPVLPEPASLILVAVLH